MRRGVYRPHLFIVKEDGEPVLRSWALSMLIQDRADSAPSYAQYLTRLKDRVWSPLRIVAVADCKVDSCR
jgi:protein transport protein SEC24